jgi:hypothetical protein
MYVFMASSRDSRQGVIGACQMFPAFILLYPMSVCMKHTFLIKQTCWNPPLSYAVLTLLRRPQASIVCPNEYIN